MGGKKLFMELLRWMAIYIDLLLLLVLIVSAFYFPFGYLPELGVSEDLVVVVTLFLVALSFYLSVRLWNVWESAELRLARRLGIAQDEMEEPGLLSLFLGLSAALALIFVAFAAIGLVPDADAVMYGIGLLIFFTLIAGLLKFFRRHFFKKQQVKPDYEKKDKTLFFTVIVIVIFAMSGIIRNLGYEDAARYVAGWGITGLILIGLVVPSSKLASLGGSIRLFFRKLQGKDF